MTSTRSCTLADLAGALGELVVEVQGDPTTSIDGLSYDSRVVAPGDLFFCVPGAVTDGHRFARQAVAAGAVALCVERPTGVEVATIVVSDARRALGRSAATYLEHPSDDMLVVGVTGTNGKTTTAFLVESIMAADGRTTGLIGTIETRIAGDVEPGTRTTPESLDLQRLFVRMREAGVDSVAMEVTSHGLALHRVEAVRFASVGFTNLTQDHLDFHTGMEDYFAAKRELFLSERAERGAVNVDDPYGRRLLAEVPIPCIGFGISDDAEVSARDVKLEPSGTRLSMVTPHGDVDISTQLVGHFNVSNCLCAAALAMQAGVGLEAIQRGIVDLAAVPGRFEAVDAGQPFSVLVDYAHTPDSLDNVLKAARPLADAQGGRVLCAFGCGGDRDRGKRPLMGSVAARLADVTVVTSDNPRSEDPMAIIGEIVHGVNTRRAEGPDAVLVDRREAIHHVVGAATAGDVVVIAGKGHETGQELADRTVPFDDRLVARDALAALGYEGGSR